MYNFRLLGICVLSLALSGCGGDPKPTPDQMAKTEMIGMSVGEIITCLGQPVKRVTEEGVSPIWSYTYGTCTANLTIAHDNKVASVTYTIKTVKDKPDDDDLPSEAEQCARVPEVASCVRWLRH